MYKNEHISIVIPAYNEAQSIGQVVAGLKKLKNDKGNAIVCDIVVCDNASSDNTGELAKAAGARVVVEKTPGYGSACLSAIDALSSTDIVVFIDGDNSVDVKQLPALLETLDSKTDLVIGARARHLQEAGAMLLQQRFGDYLACLVMRLIWGVAYTDLGPFRAIRSKALTQLNMQDTRFGWTVEMQVRAIQEGLSVKEHPVAVLKRAGKSKISGTIKGTALACVDIFGTIFKLRWLEFKGQLPVSKTPK